MSDRSPSDVSTNDGPSDSPADDRSGFERFRAFARAYPAREALGDAWNEHRRYVGFATALFVFGIVVGAALALAGYNLLEMIAEVLDEDLFPAVDDEDLTARFFIANNSLPYFLSILGVITLGIYTVWIMVFNGVIVGNVVVAIAETAGADFVIVGVAPHGVFELPALFIAAGVGFRLLHRFASRVRGTREAAISRPYLYRTAILVVVGWLLLALAAVIEAHVTPELLDAFFADRIDETGTAFGDDETSIAAATDALRAIVDR